MKKLLLTFVLLLAPSLAWAQCNGVFPNNTACGNITGSSNTPRPVPLSSFPTTTPGGTTGQIQYNNSGAFGGFTASGDATINTSTGAVTVSKSGGVAFGSLAFESAVLASQLPAGIETNVLAAGAVIITTPAVDSTFCGKISALGGNAFFAYTVGAASGFTANCILTVQNVDGWTSGRGKSLSISGLSVLPNNILYPTGIMKFRNVNNAWVQEPTIETIQAPLGQKLYVDSVNGSDSNDCLAIGSGNACQTISWVVMHILWQQLVATGGSSTGGTPGFDIRLATNASCVPATGVNCYSGLHWSGNPKQTEGHNAVLLECDGGSATNCTISDSTGNQAIGLYACGVYLELKNVTLAGGSSNNNDIQAECGTISLQGGVVLNATGSTTNAILNAIYHGIIIGQSITTTIGTGTSGYLAQAAKGGIIDFDTGTFSFAGNATYSQQTMGASLLGLISLVSTTFTLNGHTITATNNIGCLGLSMISTNGSSSNIPGTNLPISTCTSSNNGNYN